MMLTVIIRGKVTKKLRPFWASAAGLFPFFIDPCGLILETDG